MSFRKNAVVEIVVKGNDSIFYHHQLYFSSRKNAIVSFLSMRKKMSFFVTEKQTTKKLLTLLPSNSRTQMLILIKVRKMAEPYIIHSFMWFVKEKEPVQDSETQKLMVHKPEPNIYRELSVQKCTHNKKLFSINGTVSYYLWCILTVLRMGILLI